jgi:hypothetical protein
MRSGSDASSKSSAFGSAVSCGRVVPQFQVTLSRRQHVRLSLGASIPATNRSGRSTQAMAYFLWDWFDGGLFEAW